jgi:hypothetical protein
VHLLKTTFVGLIVAAICLPSLAQTQGVAKSPVGTAAPNKITTTAKATVATNPTPAKNTSSAGPKVAQKSRSSVKQAKGKKAQEAQVRLPPPPPPPPPTPAQLPPNPARVTMRDGLLTIDANNSTLADVLTGVRRETKAAIDLPPGATAERVVANLGPGTPQNVLTALLNGSRFDYIILGSQDQPDAVQRVILRAKSGPEAAPGAVAVAQRPPNANVQAPPPDDGEDQAPPTEEVPDENNQQPPQQEIDNEQQQGQQGQPGQQQQQQPGVKTPEQLLEELRQMQQQQQEQQQQQQQQQPQPQYQQQQQQQQQPPPDEQ